MESPFIFDVAQLIRQDLPQQVRQVGPSPQRIGPEMIAIAQGEEVTVDAILTPLGGGVMVDATVEAELSGECVRCLRPLSPRVELSLNQVFSINDDFITGDDVEEEDELPRVEENRIDIEQAVTDEAGLNLPFNPTCEGGCPEDSETPAPDGLSGEKVGVDPRWAGLEKFL